MSCVLQVAEWLQQEQVEGVVAAEFVVEFVASVVKEVVEVVDE